MYAYLPSLVAIYNYQYNAQRNTFDFTHKDKDWFKTTLWGLNLSIPIWSSGNRKYQYKMDRIDLEKNSVLMDQVKQGLELEVQNQRSNLRSYTNQYANNKENMDLAQHIYDKNVMKYNEGVGSSSDLTQAHNQLLNAQGAYFNTILQLLNAKSALNKALNNY
jgi:outer membrane protein TolC